MSVLPCYDRAVLFDSHCHLDFDVFDHDRDDVVRAAERVGVRGVLLPAVGLNESQRVRELSVSLTERGWSAGFGVGTHPFWLTADAEPRQFARLLEARVQALNPDVIGECGVDAPSAKRGGATLEQQRAVLKEHLALARAVNKPLVLHVVGAHGLVLELLREFGGFPAGFVLHSYSGGVDLVPQYEQLGGHFGFGAAAVRPGARRPVQSARQVSPERLLLETDAPDQPREKGDRNSPAEVASIASELAVLLGQDPHSLARTTWDNAIRVFGLNPAPQN